MVDGRWRRRRSGKATWGAYHEVFQTCPVGVDLGAQTGDCAVIVYVALLCVSLITDEVELIVQPGLC